MRARRLRKDHGAVDSSGGKFERSGRRAGESRRDFRGADSGGRAGKPLLGRRRNDIAVVARDVAGQRTG